MVDTYCAKVAECVPPSDRTARGADCETALALVEPCDQVVAFDGKMSDCLHAIDAIDCGSYDPSMKSPHWPDACRILVVSP